MEDSGIYAGAKNLYSKIASAFEDKEPELTPEDLEQLRIEEFAEKFYDLIKNSELTPA